MPRTWVSETEDDRLTFKPAEVFQAGERNHHISNTSYPIAHGKVWGPYKVQRSHYVTEVPRAFQGISDLCLYSHIPFCETRCFYCEYTVVGKGELDRTRDYMRHLNRELELYGELLDTRKLRLHGFDIGGGTPSFVDPELIAEHIEAVRSCFEVAQGMRISIETTPKIAAAEPHKLVAYKQAGIERISMGVQVTQPDLLRILNRDQNGLQQQIQAVENIRLAGFSSFNVDLMYGFADQSLASWKATVQHAIALNPEYITLYRMRYKLTRISDQAERVSLTDVRAQAQLAKQMLADAGYLANPGKNTFSRIKNDVGTSDYLTQRVIEGTPYLGLGLGAQTFTHTSISYNDGSAGKNLAPYFRSLDRDEIPIQDLYVLPRSHMMAKMCAVSFYFGEIDLAAFSEKFEVTLEDAYPEEVSFVLNEGLMQYVGGNFAVPRVSRTNAALSLTERGADHFNGVIALFFAPSVKKYLIERDPSGACDMHRNRAMALRVAQTGTTT